MGGSKTFHDTGMDEGLAILSKLHESAYVVAFSHCTITFTLALARVRHFTAMNVCVWGGGGLDPPVARLLIEVELCGKKHRVGRDERKSMIPGFKLFWSCSDVTGQINDQNDRMVFRQ